MISCKDFHAICKKYGLVQCGPMNQYKLPAWKNKIGGTIVATWFKRQTVMTAELKLAHFSSGFPVFTFHAEYDVDDVNKLDEIVSNTSERAKQYNAEMKMREINKDFV